MWRDFVLFVRASEDCPSVPVLYLYVPSEVVDFYTKNRIIGRSFEDWVREKLEMLGIRIPKEFFVMHPVFAYKKGFSRDVLIALPEVFLQ
ncbi:hypothetical protein [Thermocrinis sp.]|jgi:glycogen debranching enzyme|uniref:hypothetical protein n=1 Tax=Thermocrinis sp. TaxID=2024383 RepID=UPI003C12A23F